MEKHHRTGLEDGFTIVEVLVALTVFAVGIVSVTKVFDASLDTAAANSQRTRATAVATDALESARSTRYADLEITDTSTTSTTVIDGFTVARAVEATSGGYKEVTVGVSWVDTAGGHEVS